MPMIRTVGALRGMLPLAVVAALATGCAAQSPGDGTEVYRAAGTTPGGVSTPSVRSVPSAPRVPSAPADFLCPGEKPTRSPSPTDPATDPAAPSADHFAENHGFEVPFPLHGQSRCTGLAAVSRVETALEPLRKRGDFAPESVRSALVALGYPAGTVEAYQNGPTGVSFLVTVGTSPVCVEGTMDRASTHADAFGGYPDHASCDRPTGGH